MIEGPFSEDFTSLKWQYSEHWSGESAVFRVAGLEAYVRDMDGDSSYWELRDLRTKAIISEGEDWGYDPPNFFKCLADAESALRTEVDKRKAGQAARLCDLNPSQIRLMAGEMTAQEMRSVQAVLKSRVSAIAALTIESV